MSKNSKLKLMESALSLFSEKGYYGASIREIIENAGVTRPVLYYYFENKEDLFCQLVEAMFSEMNARIDEMLVNVSGCRERLKALIAATFEGAQERPEMVRLILQVFFSPDNRGVSLDRERLASSRFERIVAIMREGIESGELAGGNEESYARMFGGIMDIQVMARLRRPEPALTRELGEMLVDLFLDGVGSPGKEVSVADTDALEAPA